MTNNNSSQIRMEVSKLAQMCDKEKQYILSIRQVYLNDLIEEIQDRYKSGWRKWLRFKVPSNEEVKEYLEKLSWTDHDFNSYFRAKIYAEANLVIIDKLIIACKYANDGYVLVSTDDLAIVGKEE